MENVAKSVEQHVTLYAEGSQYLSNIIIMQWCSQILFLICVTDLILSKTWIAMPQPLKI